MKTVIFDFDGTLADTYPIVVKIVNRIGSFYGLPKIDPESNEYKGYGVHELIKKFKMPTWKLLVFAFHTKFLMRRYLSQMKLFDGILGLLAELKAKGHDLWIFSSNTRSNIVTVLEHNGYTTEIQVVSESSLVNKGKGLAKLLQKERVSPSDAVYVGDEVRDFEGARDAGMPFVGVSWGYNTAEALEMAGAKVVAESVDKLMSEITE